MNILFVLAYYNPYIGGLEIIFEKLAEGLVQRGHKVKVITTRLKKTSSFEIINGVEIQRIWTPSFVDRYFFTALSIPAVFNTARFSDIIHTAPYNGAISGFIGGRNSGKPVIFTALEVIGDRWINLENNRLKALVYRAIEKFVYNLPYDQFTSISHATLIDAKKYGINHRQARVIYCGVDPQFSPGPATGILRNELKMRSSDFIYLYYGRPGITKGVDILLKAAPQIQRIIPNAQLVLLLANEPKKQFESISHMAKDLEQTARIYLIPSVPRDELIRYLRDSNCIVIPSLTEGFGLTTAEACALDIPVVATQVGSIPEVISGRNVLVEPNSPQSIADGVVRIWRGDWDFVPKKIFSWDDMVDAYEEIYTEVHIKI